MAKSKYTLLSIYLAGSLEFILAAIATLQIDPDPKNALIFGYSLGRIALFGLILLPGLALLGLAYREWREKTSPRFVQFLQDKASTLKVFALGLGLLAVLTLVTPFPWLGGFSGYFHRLQPCLLVLLSFPAQVVIFRLIQTRWNIEQAWLRLVLAISGMMAAFWLLVALTGLGISPEKEVGSHVAWFNIAGTPITTFEWLTALLCALAAGFVCFWLLRPAEKRAGWLDAGLMLALILITGLVWAGTPFKDSTFIKISPPYYQPFPSSDALVHDRGGLSILAGQGINFGVYTDKPLYMVFLAILHLFSGYNYGLLVSLQIWVMACMAPALYWLGKSFHSRGFGLLSAMLLLAHQANAIQLTSVLYYNAAPNLLLTEVPTLFAIILFTWVCFAWMKNPRAASALAAGGILGVSSLLRLNAFLILPFIPAFALLVTRDKKVWLRHSLLYLLGFFLLITPWLVIGQDAYGRPYFFVKFYDIVNARYSDTTAAIIRPTSTPEPTATLDALLKLTPTIEPTATPTPAFTPTPTSPPLNPEIEISEEIPTSNPFWLLDINHFPGFIINNSLHNITEERAILTPSGNSYIVPALSRSPWSST